MTDLDDMKQTAQQATRGPWIAIKGDDEDTERWMVCTGSKPHYYVATIENGAPEDTLETEASNARMIALANPATILRLIQRVEAAEKVVNKARSIFTDRDGAHGTALIEREGETDLCGDLEVLRAIIEAYDATREETHG